MTISAPEPMTPGSSATCSRPPGSSPRSPAGLPTMPPQHELCRRMNQESLYFTRLAGDKNDGAADAAEFEHARRRPRDTQGKRSRSPARSWRGTTG